MTQPSTLDSVLAEAAGDCWQKDLNAVENIAAMRDKIHDLEREITRLESRDELVFNNYEDAVDAFKNGDLKVGDTFKTLFDGINSPTEYELVDPSEELE